MQPENSNKQEDTSIDVADVVVPTKVPGEVVFVDENEREDRLRWPYDVEMYARYLLITFKDPQNNIPPSLVAGMFAVMGTMICEFSMYKALEGYSEWQKDKLHFLFTPLNSLFWCAVYFLLETGEPIDLDELFNDPGDR